MTFTHLEAPSPLVLVDPDEFHAIVNAADHEFVTLEAEAAEALSTADRAEARAADMGINALSAPAALASLQRFLTDWRGEVERDADSVVDAARIAARVRLDEAHAEAERAVRARNRGPLAPPVVPAKWADRAVARVAPERAAVEPVDVAPIAPSAPVASAPAVSEPTRVPVVAPTQPPVEPVAEVDVAPVEVEPASPAAVVSPVVTTVAPMPSSMNGVAAMGAAMPETRARELLPDGAAVDEHELFGPPATIVAPTVGPTTNGHRATQTMPPPAPPVIDATAATPAAAVDASVDTNGAATSEFWVSPDEPKRKRGLGRFPVSAFLEVAAVLLILVFILLRLS